MAKKLNYYRGYGEKLISLFARLLFSMESYSLTELSRMLDCSKQTVMRLVNDIRMAYGVDIEESIERNRKYYRLVTKGKSTPVIPLTASELNALQMCKTFTEHLLGEPFYNEATRALEKTLPCKASQNLFISRNHLSSRQIGQGTGQGLPGTEIRSIAGHSPVEKGGNDGTLL